MVLLAAGPGMGIEARQFIATLVTIVVLLFGSAGLLSWQNARLMDQMEKRFDERITAVEQNLTARFEDLRQVILSQQQEP